MAGIFVSYSRKDEAFARRLAKSLSDLGGNIWMDVEDIPAGMNWSSAIHQGLQLCDVMIVILTPSSAASRNVEEEWQYYRDKGKPVIPVLLQPAEVHYQLSRIQYIDFHTQDYDTALRQLDTQLRHNSVVLKPISASEKGVPIPAQKLLPVRGTRQRWYWVIGVAVAAIALLIAIIQTTLNNSGQGSIPLGFPGNPVTGNAQWTPQFQTFDGVEMALVPVGCFMMGRSDGVPDERPVHQQCFHEPFWIDRFEVTNKQFAQFDGVAGASADWPNPDQPRTSVTWYEARDFCDTRDGVTDDPPNVGVRLPTEREWEYAARGPNSLIYPWGNAFAEDYGVYNADTPADIGSRPGGVAWVGAYDMSGNVIEWISSAFEDYPYNLDDGREELERTDVERVLRGSSFSRGDSVSFRPAAIRFKVTPGYESDTLGFRCALSQ